MADRRPLAIAFVLITIAIAIFTATFLIHPGGVGGNNGNLSQGSGTRGSGTKGSHSRNDDLAMERGSVNAASTLPQDIELLEATKEGTVTGKVLCGNCTYKTGEACNVMIYDEAVKHLVTVLPNETYKGLEALIGST